MPRVQRLQIFERVEVGSLSIGRNFLLRTSVGVGFTRTDELRQLGGSLACVRDATDAFDQLQVVSTWFGELLAGAAMADKAIDAGRNLKACCVCAWGYCTASYQLQSEALVLLLGQFQSEFGTQFCYRVSIELSEV